MHRVFVEPCQIDEENHLVRVTGDEVNHIKNVLRMKPGEEIDACESISRRLYRCRIEEYGTDQVLCRLCFVKEADTESPSRIILFQGLPKADKMELIIQKAVELGAARIIPVSCLRSVVRLDDKKAARKTERWQAIAEGAAAQSRRSFVPSVGEVMSFREAAEYSAVVADHRFIPYELYGMDEGGEEGGMKRTRELFSRIKRGESVALFIGPEGGFDESEIKLAMEKGMVPITMGRRILRTETAAIAALSWLLYVLED